MKNGGGDLKNFLFFAFCFLLLAFCSGCNGRKPAGGEIIATVGGEKIYFSEVKRAAGRLNRFLKENFDTNDKWRADYVHQYVARYALSKRAKREGLDKDKDVAFDMEQVRRNILADKLLAFKLSGIQPGEDGIKRYYEENKSRYKDKPLEKIREQVQFDYEKAMKDQAVNRFIMDTFVEEKVKFFEDVIANAKP